MIRKTLSLGTLGVILVAITAFTLSFAITYVLAMHRGDSSQSNALITPLGSDKDHDGLSGPVHRVRTETVKLSVKSGKLLEGARELLELTTYDAKGKRIDNSYFLVSSDAPAGKEEYVRDDKGNVSEMTVRDDAGSILSRQVYAYEYDAVGNWTKMTTSTVMYEGGKVTFQPTEISYRNIAYYFDQAIAEIAESNPPGTSTGEQNSQSNLASLNHALEAWIAATNAQDINRLMKFYSSGVDGYYRARNVSHEFVREDKQRWFRRADSIKVLAEKPEITIGRDDDVATMRFRKDYVVTQKGRERSGAVIQQLRWQHTKEGWKIISERDVRVIR
jgi:hypothetical protein